MHVVPLLFWLKKGTGIGKEIEAVRVELGTIQPRMAIVGRLERMMSALDKTVKDMLVVKQLRWDIARLEGTVGLNSTNLSKLNEHYRKTFVSFKQQLSSLTQGMNNNINTGSGQNNILLLQNEVAALQGNFQTLQ